MISVKLIGLKFLNGQIFINFEDGSEYAFDSFDSLKAWAIESESNVQMVQKLCVAYMLARSTGIDDDLETLVGAVLDKNFVLDASDVYPVRIE